MKNQKYHILAVESSADETSAAVLCGEKKSAQILSNITYSQIAEHEKTGGIVPEVAARNHIPKVIPAIEKALAEAKIILTDIDAFAASTSPGLLSSLLIGADTARALAFANKKPFIAINHMEGHLLSALADDDLRFSTDIANLLPAVGLVVSGGHTMLILVTEIGKYKILGQTLDDAAGEAFDKTAKILGLPYPGGPAISERAQKWHQGADRDSQLAKINLPRPMIDSGNFDFSFSGLKTAVLYKVEDLKANQNLSEEMIDQICYEIENAIVEVLVHKTIKAANQYKAKTVLLGGGVSANQTLRKSLQKNIGSETNSQLLIPKFQLTTDNAGMISLAAAFHFLNKNYTDINTIKTSPNEELSSWR